jgi:hypothetical protein
VTKRDKDPNFESELERHAAIHDDVTRKVREIFTTLSGDRAQRLEGLLPEDVREAIAQSLQADYDPDRSSNIAFHLLDWNSDAAFLVALLLYPERFTKQEISVGVTSFLVHAPNHLAAAAKLFGTPIEDTFEVNALVGDDDDT